MQILALETVLGIFLKELVEWLRKSGLWGMDDVEKEGGRRKLRAHMEESGEVPEELALTNMIKQAKSDHDAIILDTIGRKLREKLKDPRLFFKFDACWEKDKVSKEIIKKAWCMRGSNIMENFKMVSKKLGLWQHNRYRKMRNNICLLTEQIDKMINSPYGMSNTDNLKEARFKLGNLYAEEERYWAQRSRIRWLKEGDRNTR
ncbi:hypothetical protein GOBAR_AA09145 [Gossypium barbadense]|uniref:Uncharacterized protein n=1 Tax=Gossypium barbadense TaxID=3634 RepID=A0A2P5Y7B5_GOSBA|nr:hypothetical protein GOBAR_AA09145 [Gossypium barbadense]